MSADRRNRRRSALRGILARGPLGVSSQALNSVSNLLATVTIARVSSPSEYGAWALGYTAYAISLHFTRATASTPIMLAGDADEDSGAREVNGGLVAALITGLVTGILLVVIAGVSGLAQPLTSALMVFAAIMPLLLANDVLRNVFFRNAKPAWAVLMDATWLVVQIAGAILLTATDAITLVTGTASWALGALFALLPALVLLRARPRLADFRWFVRTQRSVGAKLVADSALVAGSTYMIPVFVAAISGLAATGALRAGQTLMGGVNIMVMGLTPMLTMESRKALKRGIRPGSILWRWSAVIAAASAVYAVFILWLPDTWGRALVGQSWSGAAALLLPLALMALARGPYTAGPVLLKAAMDLNGLIVLRLQTAVPSVVCPVVGAVIAGAEGAAWGLLVGALVTDVLCVVYVTRRARRRVAHSIVESASDAR